MKARDAARLLRRNPTPAEERLWSALRRRQLDGLRFRRQHEFGRFIGDFYCPSARLIVEVDGGVHEMAEARAHDRDRDAGLMAAGYRICRVTNDDVFAELAGVLERIREAAGVMARTAPSPDPSPTA